jgi:hypothetical protein
MHEIHKQTTPSVALTVTFGRSYLEAAIITLYEFCKADIVEIEEITGILILTKEDKEDPDLAQDLNVLRELITKTAQCRPPVKVNLIDDFLPQFKAYHFNNVVFHKLLSPGYIETNAPLQLNIDAGFLVGPKINHLLSYYLEQIQKKQSVVIACIGEDLNSQLPAYFQKASPLTFYPKGGLVFFCRRRYFEGHLNRRFLDQISISIDKFQFPDQELLATALGAEEILRLVDIVPKSVFIRYLWADYYLRSKEEAIPQTDFSLYKIAGLLKPWHYFVQDPEKSRYLVHREAVSEHINFERSNTIRAERESIPRKDLLINGLKCYEYILRQQFIPDPH